MVRRIFLSHAESDAALAQLLHDELRRARPDVDVFVSSVPGAIPTGIEWRTEIKQQLKAADAYLALLTPASVQRQWVWFESGAAFMSDRLFVGVCASGLRKSAVPSPLSGQQLLSFDSPAECVQVFKEFGVPVYDADSLWTALRAAAQIGADRLSKG
jgi:TIR domain-containing protein